MTFQFFKSTKATRWTLLVLTWVAFLLRTVTLGSQSLWRDEVDAIRFSDWSLQELIAGLVRVGHNGPLFFLLLRGWRTLVENSEFALRYPSALLGTLAVPLGFILARQLGFSRIVGLLVALFLGTSPYLIWYGQEAKMYALLLVLVILAFIAYHKALSGDSPPPPFQIKKITWVWWVVFVTATTLSYYVHILAPLMLPVYAVTALLLYPRSRRHWRGLLISMTLLIAPYIPLAIWQVPRLLAGYQSGHPFYPFSRQFFLLLKFYTNGLVPFSPVDILISIFSNNVPAGLHPTLTYLQKPAVSLIPIVLAVFLFLMGFLPKSKRSLSTLPQRLILAAWTLLPPLIVYFISRRVPVFEDRYLIYITPAFYLLMAVGLAQLWRYSRWLAQLCLLLILLFNLTGIWQQQRHPIIKANFRAAAQYLAAQPYAPKTIMIHIPYLQYTFNYYYPHKYKLLEGLWTNDDKTEATVNTEMTAHTANVSELWLVVSEENLWDNRHLVRDWLNEHGVLADEAHFVGVYVYHYQLTPGTINQQSIEQ